MPITVKAEMVGGRGIKDFVRFVRETGALEVRAGVEAATEGLKDELRDLVAAAGLGDRLGKAIGGNVYPKGGKGSLGAAGFVFPRGKKAAAIFESFNEGTTIRAKGGKFLAIPTKEAGRAWRNGKARPQEFQERTGIKLRFVKLKNGNAVLVGDAITSKSGRGVRAATKGRRRQGRAAKPLVFFVLIRSMTVPRRLNFSASAQKWADRIPQLIEAAKQGDE